MLTTAQKEWVIAFLGPAGTAKYVDWDGGPPKRGKQGGAGAANGEEQGTERRAGHGKAHKKDPKAGPDQAEDGADGADGANGADGAAPGTTEAFALPVIPPVVIDVAKGLTDPQFAHCVIVNQTDQVLFLDTGTLKDPSPGEWQKKPPGKVAANKTEAFDAHSYTIAGRAARGVEATVRYFVGDKGTTWDLHFDNPHVGSNSADATLAGANKDKYDTDYSSTEGNKGVFTFLLGNAGGGTGPQPHPSGGGAQTSCLVTIANQTQQTLHLRKQDKASGDYMGNPPTSLAPGASTQFAFIQTPGGNETELRGLMTWDVGDPKVATWELMWDNPTGKKNYTAGILKPDNAGLHSLDQIGQGDENVPVTFTLSGSGGQGPSPQGGKGSSCEITIVNNTKSVLSLTGEQTAAGAFATNPPTKIEAGATVKVGYASAPNSPDAGCVGSLEYSVGEGGAAAWAIDWNNPAGQANTCNGLVTPGSAGFKSSASIGPGDEKVPVSFVLSGGGDGPEPVEPEPEFDQPPKGKQPTLRKGDKSPDGWVEYAQRLLKKRHGAALEINGDFDAKMKAEVEKFQAGQKPPLLKDGVIGNETWSALREGKREPVGTDGRQPHTFEEKGAQARFVVEAADDATYLKSKDTYRMWVVSTGEQPVEGFSVTLKVTQPDGTSHTGKTKIGPVTSASPDGQGNGHSPEFKKFLKTFKIPSVAVLPSCKVDAYLDAAIGGDSWSGMVTVEN